MGKFWSLLFLLVPVLGVACFAVAPWYKIWLPSDVSEHGHMIDHLFYFILWLTAVVFVITEVALFWFMWRYDKQTGETEISYGGQPWRPVAPAAKQFTADDFHK